MAATKWLTQSVSLCLFFISFLFSARAQTGDVGSIEGIVTDPSGAAVPGAMSEAKNLATAATFETTTNDFGLFYFPILPVGTYELQTKCPGFAVLLVHDVTVTVGARINLNLKLQVAERSESVVVHGGASVVETTRSQVSSTIDFRLLSDLPVNGRDFTSFVLLTPGVTTDVRGGLSFVGQRAMNALQVDGVNGNDAFFDQPLGGQGFPAVSSQSAYDISQDAVEEFQVNTNSYSAELGRAAGGVINVVTKSGTNQFHGTAFEFYRDRALNANDPINKLLGLPKNPFHFNQFGGSLGGPILRERLFFFANYDGLRTKFTNPVVLGLPVNFQLSQDPVIEAFQKRAVDYLAPRAHSWSAPFSQNDFLTKIDWQLGPQHHLTERWSRQRLSGVFPADQQTSFESANPTALSTDELTISWNAALSGSRVNVLRFAYERSEGQFFAENHLPGADIFEGGQPVLTIGGDVGIMDENSKRGQWADTFSWLRGRHSLRAGADFELNRNLFFSATEFSGNYEFDSLESFGRSLSGVPRPEGTEFFRQAFSGVGTPGAFAHPNYDQFAAFLQDEWRLQRKLTLNWGSRYDLQAIAHPALRNPSPALAAAGIDTSLLRVHRSHFVPRLGFAWSPLASQRLVLRGGYGVFFGLTNGQTVSRANVNDGVLVQSRTFVANSPTAELIPAYPNNFCGHPDPAGTPPDCFPPVGGASTPSITLFSPTFTQPYTQQWSLGLEIGFAQNVSLSVSYMAAKGSHLQRTRDVNLVTPESLEKIGVAGETTAFTYSKFTLPRPVPGFARILEYESAANSFYQGLAVQVRKRFSGNVQFLSSYTYGKVIDDNPNQYALNPGPADPNMLSDPANPRADRGPGSNDQRHRFVFAGIWGLNYARGLSATPRAILGGWQLSGILTAQTGQPYSAVVRGDLNNDGNSSNDRVPGTGRNAFYLPSTISVDPRLMRKVSLSEHIELRLGAEAFNVFNRANYVNVRTVEYALSFFPTVCGSAGAPCLLPRSSGPARFGAPTASAGPRILQFSARLVF